VPAQLPTIEPTWTSGRRAANRYARPQTVTTAVASASAVSLGRSCPTVASLVVHTAHPNDNSNVDAYIVYKPSQGVWTHDP